LALAIGVFTQLILQQVVVFYYSDWKMIADQVHTRIEMEEKSNKILSQTFSQLDET